MRSPVVGSGIKPPAFGVKPDAESRRNPRPGSFPIVRERRRRGDLLSLAEIKGDEPSSARQKGRGVERTRGIPLLFFLGTSERDKSPKKTGGGRDVASELVTEETLRHLNTNNTSPLTPRPEAPLTRVDVDIVSGRRVTPEL
ncbi:hypothetical protein EYF80_050887 [Liparis tanakae]|uniref:Uncharacterized protein n=1 Tax=Liparis tanakae TaxID=230148 RepID=A0A4Z2FDA7_9TELE|nr:hypothetical protein EYF80_050887 [Liparis tanakae]